MKKQIISPETECDTIEPLLCSVEAATAALRQLRIKREAAPMQKDLDGPVLSPDTVISFTDWIKMVGVSENTGLAMRRAGNAPRFFHLSPKRIGTTLGEHREWLAARPQAGQRENRRIAS
jgi:hypothetical protein